jgi:hypothetical protein
VSTPVQELYDYSVLAANSTTTLAAGSCSFGGFICTTAGNFALNDASNNPIIAAIGVVVGQQILGGIACPFGAKVVLSGGAAGTALVNR